MSFILLGPPPGWHHATRAESQSPSGLTEIFIWNDSNVKGLEAGPTCSPTNVASSDVSWDLMSPLLPNTPFVWNSLLRKVVTGKIYWGKIYWDNVNSFFPRLYQLKHDHGNGTTEPKMLMIWTRRHRYSTDPSWPSTIFFFLLTSQ